MQVQKDPLEILCTYSPRLTDVIEWSIERVATHLCAKCLIPQSIENDLLTKIGVSNYSKATKIMAVLRSNLMTSSDQKKFLTNTCHVLIEIDEHQNLTDIASKILADLGNYNIE